MPQIAHPHEFFDRAASGARGFGGWLGRIGFGLFVFVAAGFALLATTFIGLSLAVAAIFLKMTHTFTSRSARTTSQSADARSQARRKDAAGADGEPPALDAHRTPDGWVVDNNSSSR